MRNLSQLFYGKKFRIILVIFIGLLLVLALVFAFARSHKKVGNKSYSGSVLSAPKTGYVNVVVQNIADPASLNVALNGSPTTIFNLDQQKLPAGSYNLAITKSGYKKFTVDFSIIASQTTVVNATLQMSQKPSATSLDNVVSNAPNQSGISSLAIKWPSATATAKYFDNDTWAYVTVNTKVGLGLAYFVVCYDSTSNKWIIERGPMDDSDAVGSLQGLPVDLQNYLRSL